jgi:hypothetical protein
VICAGTDCDMTDDEMGTVMRAVIHIAIPDVSCAVMCAVINAVIRTVRRAVTSAVMCL